MPGETTEKADGKGSGWESLVQRIYLLSDSSFTLPQNKGSGHFLPEIHYTFPYTSMSWLHYTGPFIIKFLPIFPASVPASQVYEPDDISHTNDLADLQTENAFWGFQGLAHAPPEACNALHSLFHLVNAFSALRSKYS